MNVSAPFLAAAVAGMTLGALACESSTKPTGDTSVSQGVKHGCKGQNACKGQGGCKSDSHSCKGQNACKGQGGCKG